MIYSSLSSLIFLLLEYPQLIFFKRSEDSTDGESLCERLWEETKDLRYEALKTKWIQGIGNGDLDPNDYGKITNEQQLILTTG